MFNVRVFGIFFYQQGRRSDVKTLYRSRMSRFFTSIAISEQIWGDIFSLGNIKGLSNIKLCPRCQGFLELVLVLTKVEGVSFPIFNRRGGAGREGI